MLIRFLANSLGLGVIGASTFPQYEILISFVLMRELKNFLRCVGDFSPHLNSQNMKLSGSNYFFLMQADFLEMWSPNITEWKEDNLVNIPKAHSVHMPCNMNRFEPTYRNLVRLFSFHCYGFLKNGINLQS